MIVFLRLIAVFLDSVKKIRLESKTYDKMDQSQEGKFNEIKGFETVLQHLEMNRK